MASYIAGVTDTPNPYPLYTPDFVFLQQQQQMQDARFEQGAAPLKSAYSAILNAPLSNPENIQARDHYLKDAAQKLRNLSQADMSLPENQRAAMSVYAPFWQDKDLLADAVKTKTMQSALQQGYSYLNAQDDKERNKFWMEGIDYINNNLRKLQSARRGDGSIQQIDSRRYIPNYDLMGFLKEKAGTQGLKITRSYSDNGYKITKVNGDETGVLFEDWVKQQLQGNQAALDVFRVRGTVDFEGKVNTLISTGYSPDQAKDVMAKSYISQQKDLYQKNLDESNHHLSTLISRRAAMLSYLDGKYQGGIPVTDPEDLKKAEELKNTDGLIDRYRKKVTDYTSVVTDYGNPASKKYAEDYNTIFRNGESYYASAVRDKFIRGAARSLMIQNASYDYDVDPGVKLNKELERQYAYLRERAWKDQMQYGDDNDGTATSSSPRNGSGKATSKTNTTQELLDNPVPMGLTVHGNDPISAYQRMQGIMTGKFNEYIGGGFSIIRYASLDDKNFKVSDRFLDNLQSGLLTGKYTDGSSYVNGEMQRELDQLKQQGIIPNSPDFTLDKPSGVYSALVNYGKNYYSEAAKNGSISSPPVIAITSWDRNAQQYQGLKKFNEDAENLIKKDPLLSPIYRDGNLVTKEQYLQHNLGQPTREAYVEAYVRDWFKHASPRQLERMTSDFLPRSQAERNYEKWEKEYEDFVKMSHDKMSGIMKPYLQNEGAYIGQTIRLATDNQNQKDRAQFIAEQVLNPGNLREQVTTKDGFAPLNISQLEQAGADREEIIRIMNKYASGIGSNDGILNSVDMTKIGSRGKPSVILNLDIAGIAKKEREEKQPLSDGTVKALGSLGIELEAGSNASIPELKEGFGKGVLDSKLFDKYGTASATRFIKDMGFDYVIKKIPEAHQYVISLDYPQYVGGKLVTNNRKIYLPMNASVADIEDQLMQNIITVQNSNYQVAENLRKSSTFTVPSSTNQPSIDWYDFKQTLSK